MLAGKISLQLDINLQLTRTDIYVGVVTCQFALLSNDLIPFCSASHDAYDLLASFSLVLFLSYFPCVPFDSLREHLALQFTTPSNTYQLALPWRRPPPATRGRARAASSTRREPATWRCTSISEASSAGPLSTPSPPRRSPRSATTAGRRRPRRGADVRRQHGAAHRRRPRPAGAEEPRRGDPLHLASKAGHARVVGNLLDVLVSPADDYAAAAAAARAVNRAGRRRCTRPRARAATRAWPGCCWTRSGDLAGVVSCDGASPLYLAAMEGHEGVVRRLLRRLPVGTMVSAASYAGPDGQTALHAAVLLRETGK